MKRSKTGIVLMIVGLVFVALAPIWKWAIAPQFVKIPNGTDITSQYKGTLTLYADPEALVLYPEGQSKTIDLVITRRDVGNTPKSDSGVAVMEETMSAKNTQTGEVVVSWDKFYALNRKTSENVSGHNSDVNRTGYYIMLPMGVDKKKVYQMWDDDVAVTGDAKFVKEETLDGTKHKGVKVYVFQATSTKKDKMVAPPLGLPEQLNGATIKKVLNNPNLTIPDDAVLPIDYYKTTDATIVVEPRTGVIVELPAYHEEYFVNAALPGQPENMVKLADLTYKQANTAVVIDDTAKYFGLLDLATMWLPLIFLALGLILLLFGASLVWRKGA